MYRDTGYTKFVELGGMYVDPERVVLFFKSVTGTVTVVMDSKDRLDVDLPCDTVRKLLERIPLDAAPESE